MSKQSEAKAAQFYRAEIRKNCGNCQFYSCDDKTVYTGMRYILKRTNKRCVMGGFAVKLTGTCDKWEAAT